MRNLVKDGVGWQNSQTNKVTTLYYVLVIWFTASIIKKLKLTFGVLTVTHVHTFQITSKLSILLLIHRVMILHVFV